jgi:hypothetical protein
MNAGADLGFQVGGWGGAHLNKIAPSGGRRENCWGISCEKSRFYAKKIIFFPISGGRAPPPPLDPPLRSICLSLSISNSFPVYVHASLHWKYTICILVNIIRWKKYDFFGVKSWFFTRNTPKIFVPPSARRIFFKCAPLPSLKSWICTQYKIK